MSDENKVIYSIEYEERVNIPDDDDYGNTHYRDYTERKIVYPYYVENILKAREFVEQTDEFKLRQFEKCEFRGNEIIVIYANYDSNNDRHYTFSIRPLSLW